MLDWYRLNVCDDNPRSAWHTIHRNGALALSACSTAEDYEIVTNAMQVAAILVQTLPTWAINPPTGHTVEFNGRRVTLWCAGVAIDTKEI